MQYQINKGQSFVTDLSMDWDEVLEEKKEECGVHAETAGDGLLYSISNLGRVDISYISMITGLTKDEVIEKLKGSIYQNPVGFTGDIYEGFVTSDEYLSGNLLEKLEEAKKANYKYKGQFTDNIDAIVQVLPKGVSDTDIYYSLSSPWIPDSIKEQFICYILGCTPSFAIFIKHDPITGMWEIPSHLSSHRSNLSYGTLRMEAHKVVEHLLNMKPFAIYDSFKIDETHWKRVLNKEESLLAEEKGKLVTEKFRDYIDSSFDQKRKLTQAYNKHFGFNVSRIYNGSFIELKNSNPNITLFDYQKNAIARIILSSNTFLAHNVGAGKTFEMIAGGEELLRIGKSKKNLYVVPNSILGEWGKAYRELYPNSTPLILNSSVFTKAKKRKTLELIRDTQAKAIIIPYSVFDSIPLSYMHKIKVLIAKLDEINKVISLDKQETRGLKALKKSVQAEIDKVRAEGPSLDEDIAFDQLGFTHIFVDEAHNYKNIPITTKAGFVRGINCEGSAKCQHMLDILDYVHTLPTSGVVMASGTPITNSITDIYAIQRYLQHGELKLLDLAIFDNWASMFAESKEDFEIDIDTSNYRVVQRFSKFHNLPELTQVLSNVCDFYFAKNSKEIPDFNGYSDTVIKKDKDLASYLKNITNRIEGIRNGSISRQDDNMLKVTNDGRKAALDLRLIDYDKYQHIKSGKLFSCAENIMTDYALTNSFKGTQLVFSDLSTPKDTFNVYDELKYILVHFGIPSNEIAYIHSYETEKARTKLFEAVRKGEIRILMGSSFKLGTGVNVQDRLYSIHHLSIPWRPADMVQREGRIIRQGNMNKEVFIHRYITEGSFDAYSWQILETKQKFINELLSNSVTDRSQDDIQDTVLSYAEVKALAIGNPLLKEHVDLKNQINRLNMLKKRTETQRCLLEKELLEIPNRLKEYQEKTMNLAIDSKHYKESKREYNHEETLELRKLFFNSLMDHINQEEEKLLIHYQGFDFYLPPNLLPNNLYFRVKGAGSYAITIGNSDIGAVIRIDNYLDSLDTKLEEAKGHIRDLKARKLAIEEQLSKTPDYSSEIEKLAIQLLEVERKLEIND